MTWADLVRFYFPDLSDHEAMDVLWCCTGYPTFYSGDPVLFFSAQLADAKKKYGNPRNASRNCIHTRAMRPPGLEGKPNVTKLFG